ncbi:serpin B6-like [Spea bombifrons]|uniref:serpin B6-like n=1 Tax=Spea bombifrons TaxID=233779 RepID=UPI00234935FC|nr:serpin B6-like [Spea bombifrons]
MEAISVANNQFTADIAKNVVIDQNLAMSSFSIFVALAMSSIGARNTTETQMKKTLHLDNIRDVHPRFKELFTSLSSQEYILDIANGLFVEQTFPILNSFLQDVSLWYNVEPENVDFLGDSEGVRQHINSLIEQQTKGLIQDLLPSGSVSSDTVSVVTNAIYLAANWSARFQRGNTANASFTLRNNEQVTVEMMSMKAKFNTRNISEDNVRVLELPYGESKDMSMYIMMPDEGTDILEVERGITYEKLMDWTNLSKMKQTTLHVNVPRFEIEHRINPTNILKSLGMTDAFNKLSANFSGISDTTGVYITGVLHKAFIKVDEDGTEAAAATGIVFGTTSAIIPQYTFNVNRPFLFTIQQNHFGRCILFYGKFQSP